MLRRPPRSTRTDTLVPYTDALPISEVGQPTRCQRHPGSGVERRIERHVLVGWNHLGESQSGQGGEMTCASGLIDAEARVAARQLVGDGVEGRSEEHTSELQSLMRISYAVFCLKKKKTKTGSKFRRTENPKEHYEVLGTDESDDYERVHRGIRKTHDQLQRPYPLTPATGPLKLARNTPDHRSDCTRTRMT